MHSGATCTTGKPGRKFFLADEGELYSFHSEDTVDINDIEGGIDHLPVEYLHSLNPASLPLSHLQLRVGAPVILLRNLHPKQGLYNGTRMVITQLGRRCIEAMILIGQYAGIYLRVLAISLRSRHLGACGIHCL